MKVKIVTALELFLLFLSTQNSATASCSVIGKYTDNFEELITINGDLSGTATSDYICFGELPLESYAATADLGVQFQVDFNINPNCTLEHYAYELLSFETCEYASGTATQPDDGGVGSVWWERTGARGTILTGAPTIKDGVAVNTALGSSSGIGGAIAVHSDLTILVTNSGSPVPGQQMTVKTDQPAAADTITQPGATDATGSASGSIERKSKSAAVSHLISTTAEAQTAEDVALTWLPAKYEDDFETTCYITALASDWTTGAMTYDLPGLNDPTFGIPYSFVKIIKLNGSGKLSDNVTYLQYDAGSDMFSRNTQCSKTANGNCATDNYTLAIPRKYVPNYSIIQVDNVGTRHSEDVGKKISDYHVDLYYGYRYHDCINYGTRDQTLHLNSY